MSISCIKRFTVLFALLLCGSGMSQDNFEALGESGFALDHKISNVYSYNFAARSRYYVYQDESTTLKNRQIDLVHFSTLKLNYNRSISFGIQYRFRAIFDGGGNELRLTQQFNYTKRNLALRFGHRIRFEQRIFQSNTILRSRYRFALDFALKGEKLDIGEPFFVATMEALLSQNQHIKSELDHRTTAHIGWLISEKLILQFGLEYRFEAFNIETKEKLFILSSANLKI